MLGRPTEETTKSRITKCLVSMFVGMVIGVIIAEVVANSLIEISLTYVFSIVFGIAFMLLGLALSWRIWKSVPEPKKRAFMLFFAALVFLSGIFSFLLEVNNTHISPGGKVPLYMIVAVSLSFALTYSLTEFINLGLCDRCCDTNFEENPLIGSPKQIYGIFIGSVVMGSIFGIMFGSIDVEDDGARHTRFKESLLLSIPVGSILGGCLGFYNQWLRGVPVQYSPLAASHTSHENI